MTILRKMLFVPYPNYFDNVNITYNNVARFGSGSHVQITLSSIFPTYLFDAINQSLKEGYVVDALWYKKSWFFATKYYAKLSYSSNKLDICVGPVESR